MGEVKDESWLKHGICRALGWDAVVAEGIVKAISDAGSQKEVDEIVSDYMGGDAQVKRLVTQFLAPRPREAPPPGLPPAAGPASSVASASTTQAPSGFARSVPQQRLTDMQAPEDQEVDGPEIVDGLPVRRVGKGSRRGAGGPKPPLSATLERPVVNCLACGKVYDCRGTFTSDITAFVAGGGVCTFCGFHVALSHRERSETRHSRRRDAGSSPSAAAAAAGGGMAASGASRGASEATAAPETDTDEAAAVAFKNRLVEADRNSARRTTVVDDQSDFFEIDGNAWLSEEERRALRERQRAIEEAEASRRRRVTVTVDILGRQVLVTDEAGDAAEVAAGGCRADADTASAATAQEIPQGGGASAVAAAASGTQGRREDMRITRNPNIAVRPMFVRPPPKPAADSSGGAASSRSGSKSAEGVAPAAAAAPRDAKGQQQRRLPVGGRGGRGAAAGSSAAGQPPKREPRAASRTKPLPRLQHDDPFESAAIVAPAD